MCAAKNCRLIGFRMKPRLSFVRFIVCLTEVMDDITKQPCRGSTPPFRQKECCLWGWRSEPLNSDSSNTTFKCCREPLWFMVQITSGCLICHHFFFCSFSSYSTRSASSLHLTAHSASVSPLGGRAFNTPPPNSPPPDVRNTESLKTHMFKLSHHHFLFTALFVFLTRLWWPWRALFNLKHYYHRFVYWILKTCLSILVSWHFRSYIPRWRKLIGCGVSWREK